MWKFIDILKREQKARDADMALFIAGHNPPQKARKYRDANQRILVLTQTYQPLNAGNPHFFEQNQIFHDQPIIDFLARISHNYEMDT